jgi:DNA-binding PadR family transcriptional regulator
MPRRSDWPNSLTPAAFHILLALADEDRHGLGIVDEIESRSGGVTVLGPGSLYGTIKRLRETGFIREAEDAPDPSQDDSRRRFYSITPLGREALAREARRMEVTVHVARSKAVLDQEQAR